MAWLQTPSQTTGLQTFDGTGWQFESYASLARSVRVAAEELSDDGVDVGSCIAVRDGCAREVLVGTFAGFLLGASVAVLRTPSKDGKLVSKTSLRGSVRLQGVAPDAKGHYRLEIPTAARVHSVDRLRTVSDDAHAWDPAFIQLTSGTTGPRCGVRLPLSKLEGNLGMMHSWLNVRPSDQMVSWLPFSHDLGMVGALFLAAASQCTLWHQRPEQFLKNPASWLERLSTGHPSLTAAPAFGYEFLSRRIKPEDLTGFDFSAVRSAVVGAERLRASGLAAFVRLLERRGFPSTALRPAYGMAEATLAITGVPTGQCAIAVDPAMMRGSPSVLTPYDLTERDSFASGALVGSGIPLDGVEIEIDDGHGLSCDGRGGEILVRSDSLADGYLHEEPDAATVFAGPTLHTGDAGFMIDGHLFVLGRLGDSLKVRGQRFLVEQLESQLIDAVGCASWQCAVISTPGTDGQGVCVLIDESVEGAAKQAAATIRRAVGTPIDVQVLVIDARTLPRTTSGKVQRRETWRSISNGELVHG